MKKTILITLIFAVTFISPINAGGECITSSSGNNTGVCIATQEAHICSPLSIGTPNCVGVTSGGPSIEISN